MPRSDPPHCRPRVQAARPGGASTGPGRNTPSACPGRLRKGSVACRNRSSTGRTTTGVATTRTDTASCLQGQRHRVSNWLAGAGVTGPRPTRWCFAGLCRAFPVRLAGRVPQTGPMSTERRSQGPEDPKQQLTFIRWCLTPEGLRILCRCECGWLTVARAGDFAHGMKPLARRADGAALPSGAQTGRRCGVIPQQ